MFNSFGDRNNVPNVVLLLTDGPADVDIGFTEPEAQLLKNDGATIVPVGITNRYVLNRDFYS